MKPRSLSAFATMSAAELSEMFTFSMSSEYNSHLVCLVFRHWSALYNNP